MKWFAFAGIIPGLLWAQQAAPRLSVSGVVISSTGGDPVRKATVTLRAQDDGAISYEAESDGSGRFRMEDIAPGTYSVLGERLGFMMEADGASGAPPPTLKVEAGQSVQDVKVKLIPLGVISGRVLDEDGDPVRGAQVQALSYSYMGGKRELRPVDQVNANDRGEFRLFGLHPGTFYLRATGRNEGMRSMSFTTGAMVRSTNRSSAFGGTYFPSVTDATHATPIELAGGAQLRGFDIRMRLEPRYSVRGKLPGPPRSEDGAGTPNYNLQLVPRAHPVMGGNYGYSFQMDNENFEFTDVQPGSYLVVYTSLKREDGAKGMHARQPVEVVNSDVEGIVLTPAPGVDISGLVRVEGTPSRPLDKLSVNLQMESRAYFLPNAEVKPDGTFEITDLVPDIYEINLVGTHPGTYVKSIRLGDAEAPDLHIDLTKASGGPLTVVLATDVGEVEGSVKKANGDAAARVRVTLIAGRLDRSKSGFTDDQGKFHLKNVAPGEYKAFAWEDAPAGAPQDPDFRKPYEKQSTALKLDPNGHQTLELTTISLK